VLTSRLLSETRDIGRGLRQIPVAQPPPTAHSRGRSPSSGKMSKNGVGREAMQSSEAGICRARVCAKVRPTMEPFGRSDRESASLAEK